MKKRINISIDSDLFDSVRPYIDNLSFFLETCLRNFKKNNFETIEHDNYLTANFLLNHNSKDFDISILPNITYIMNNFKDKIPTQLSLYSIINNRVITNKKRILTLPDSKDFSFISNNIIKYDNKIYYFEIVKSFKSNTIKDNIKLCDPLWISK